MYLFLLLLEGWILWACEVMPYKYNEVAKRKKDNTTTSKSVEESVIKYLDSLRTLRTLMAKGLYSLLVLEILAMFAILWFAGVKYLTLESWLIGMIFDVIIVKTFATIYIIVKNLFPIKTE